MAAQAQAGGDAFSSYSVSGQPWNRQRGETNINFLIVKIG